MTLAALAPITLGLPKGRMQEGVLQLLKEAGIEVRQSARGYRPTLSVPWLAAKLLKPQNIVAMLQQGSRAVGFVGADWVAETNAQLVELLDTNLDPVRIVAAAPPTMLDAAGQLRQTSAPLRVASELPNLTQRWIESAQLRAQFVRSYGSTEVFPPDDADCIVDVVASGDTLKANNLQVVHELMRSSTRLYAHPASLDNPSQRESIETLGLLLRAALEARQRVMVEVNVASENLAQLVAVMPCMRQPTIATLHEGSGFAVKAAVPRADLPELVRKIKAAGGTDIVVMNLTQIIA